MLEKAIGIEAKKNMLPMQPGDVVQTCADVDDLIRMISDFKPQITISNTGLQEIVLTGIKIIATRMWRIVHIVEILKANKVALITGGASGMGAATALWLAKQGMRVAILDRDRRLRQNVLRKKYPGLACKPMSAIASR